MAGIFDDDNMMKEMSPYIPQGEIVKSGIHCAVKYAKLCQVIGKCQMFSNDKGFSPAEDGDDILVVKEKFADFDVYMGLTENHLIITECSRYSWAYQFNNLGKQGFPAIQEALSLQEIGPRCFSFDEIEKVEIKKGFMGAIKCKLAFKSGCQYDMLMPKLGGLGGGMPNHQQRRDMIVEFLKQFV